MDYAVILAEHTPKVTGIASNEAVAAFCKGATACSRSVRLTRCTIRTCRDSSAGSWSQGFRGLKLYPTYNFFYPTTPPCTRFNETAQELGIPGFMFIRGYPYSKTSRLKFGNPIFYDDIAVDFPELTIILCHGGRNCWYDEAVAVTRLHSNVYIDVTGLPPQKLLQYFPDMGRLAHKFLFGTDWPSVDMAKNADKLAQLPISAEAVRAILGENAKKILHL